MQVGLGYFYALKRMPNVTKIDVTEPLAPRQCELLHRSFHF